MGGGHNSTHNTWIAAEAPPLIALLLSSPNAHSPHSSQLSTLSGSEIISAALNSPVIHRWSESQHSYHGLCTWPWDLAPTAALTSLPHSPTFCSSPQGFIACPQDSIPWCLYTGLPLPGMFFSQILACVVLISFKSGQMFLTQWGLLWLPYIQLYPPNPALIIAVLCFIFLCTTHPLLDVIHSCIFCYILFIVCPPPLECGSVRIGLCCVPKL